MWGAEQQPADDGSLMHSNSIGQSSGGMYKEMLDLVDNIIDSSPKTRKDLYEKSKFSIKVSSTEEEKKPEQLSLSSMVSSVGILRYENGDVFEGQLLNGKRSGEGRIKFASGDQYYGMWKND